MKHLKFITFLSIAFLASICVVRTVKNNNSVISSLSTSNVQAYSEGNDYRKFRVDYEIRHRMTATLHASGTNTTWKWGDPWTDLFSEIDVQTQITAYAVSFTVSCETCRKRKANCVPYLMGTYVIDEDGSIRYVG